MRTNTTVGEVEKQSTTYRSPWFRSCVIGRSNSGHECASARPHQGDEATSKRRSSAACLHCSVESAFLCLTFPWHSTRSSWPRAHASATTPPPPSPAPLCPHGACMPLVHTSLRLRLPVTTKRQSPAGRRARGSTWISSRRQSASSHPRRRKNICAHRRAANQAASTHAPESE